MVENVLFKDIQGIIAQVRQHNNREHEIGHKEVIRLSENPHVETQKSNDPPIKMHRYIT